MVRKTIGLVAVMGVIAFGAAGCSDNDTVNAATGAAVGAGLGSLVGAGSGKTAAVAVGAIAGAAVGSEANNRKCKNNATNC